MYTDRCAVLNSEPVRDPATNITSMQWVEMVSGQPCRVSYEAVASPEAADGAAKVLQAVKLFVAPEIEILPGSRVTVERPGVSVAGYRASGAPAMYATHQEVPLELDGGFA